MHASRQPDLAVISRAGLDDRGFLYGLDGLVQMGCSAIATKAQSMGLTDTQARELSSVALEELLYLMRCALDADRLAHDRSQPGSPLVEMHIDWAKNRIAKRTPSGDNLDYELGYLQLVNRSMK